MGWYGDETLGVCYSLGKLTGAESPPIEDFFEAGAYCEAFEGGVRMATIRTQVCENLDLLQLWTYEENDNLNRLSRTSSAPTLLGQTSR